MFSNADTTHKVDALNPFSLFSFVHLLLRANKTCCSSFISTVAFRVAAAPLTLRGFGCGFLQEHIEI